MLQYRLINFRNFSVHIVNKSETVSSLLFVTQSSEQHFIFDDLACLGSLNYRVKFNKKGLKFDSENLH